MSRHRGEQRGCASRKEPVERSLAHRPIPRAAAQLGQVVVRHRPGLGEILQVAAGVDGEGGPGDEADRRLQLHVEGLVGALQRLLHALEGVAMRCRIAGVDLGSRAATTRNSRTARRHCGSWREGAEHAMDERPELPGGDRVLDRRPLELTALLDPVLQQVRNRSALLEKCEYTAPLVNPPPRRWRRSMPGRSPPGGRPGAPLLAGRAGCVRPAPHEAPPGGRPSARSHTTSIFWWDGFVNRLSAGPMRACGAGRGSRAPIR